MFATHYSYTWLDDVAPFSGTATWSVPGDPNAPDTLVGTIDTSFLEGQSFATWLQGVGALSAPGQISLTNVRDDVVGVVAPTSRFIYAPSQVLQFGFFTPVGNAASMQCGRVVFTDFHVSGVASIGDAGLSNGSTFPTECTPSPLTPQEKALEFMLFDLASCVPPPPQNCTPLTCQQQKINCGPAGDGCGGPLTAARAPASRRAAAAASTASAATPTRAPASRRPAPSSASAAATTATAAGTRSTAAAAGAADLRRRGQPSVCGP